MYYNKSSTALEKAGGRINNLSSGAFLDRRLCTMLCIALNKGAFFVRIPGIPDADCAERERDTTRKSAIVSTQRENKLQNRIYTGLRNMRVTNGDTQVHRTHIYALCAVYI